MMSERKQEEIAKEKLDKGVTSFIPSRKIVEEESQDVEEVGGEEETVLPESKTISEEVSTGVGTSEKEVVTSAEVTETDVSLATKPMDGNQEDRSVDIEGSSEVKVEMENVALKVEEMKVADQNLDTENEMKKPISKDEEETSHEDFKTDDGNQNAEAAIVSVPAENVESDSREKLTEKALAEEVEENDNAAGDVGLPDAHRTEEGKTIAPSHKQEHMGEEEIREPVSDEFLESINRDKRLSTETDDSSDAYTDVLVEDDDEEEEESAIMADAGKGESLDVDYVQLNEESPMELDGKMRRHIRHGSEEDLENKQQDSLNVEESAHNGMPVSVDERFHVYSSLSLLVFFIWFFILCLYVELFVV